MRYTSFAAGKRFPAGKCLKPLKRRHRMKDFVVQTRQASKAYGSFYALKQVSMHVKQGDIYGLIGDNGAGKSTLLKLLTGLARATEGEIRLWGKYEEKELKR